MDARNLLRALAACGALTFSGCAIAQASAPDQGRTLLTPAELKALISTAKSIRISTQGAKVNAVYSQDGVARVEWGTGGASGTWRLDGNRFCSKYPGIRRGYETCYVFQKTGENTYNQFYADGGPDDGRLIGLWVVEK